MRLAIRRNTIGRAESQAPVTRHPRYATEAEAMEPGTRKLRAGFYWGRGGDRGLIVRSQ